MAQYIDKSALVAEIKRLLDRYVSVLTFNYRATKDLNHLLSFIDTLEVKDVDLEKEKDSYMKIHKDIFTSVCQAILDGDDD